MKKIFLPLLILPSIILSSCNKESGGFDNPFPNDDYIKTGFKIASDEMIVRALTTLETATIDNTLKNIDDFDKYINIFSSEIHERSYMKAFAGEYSQGMDVKNVKTDKNETKIKYSLKKDSEDKVINPRRLVTESTSKLEEQYSYGSQVKENEKITTYIHQEEDGKYIEKEPSTTIYNRIKSEKGKNPVVTKVSEEKYGEYAPKTEGGGGDEFYTISQKSFIKEPDIHSGVNESGQVVILTEKKEPYPGDKTGGKSGYIKLKDGREYCALNNSISVAKLELKEKKNRQKWETWESDWYLVNSFRTYTETIITSEIIQPNVPVTYLKNGIVISFKEEKGSFAVKEPRYTEFKDLPEITKEEK